MNNSGFNGTGTAFILYIILAFCMPLVFLYRLAKHRHDHGRQFVLGHFILGLFVTAVAVLVIGYAWRLLALSKGGDVHAGLVLMAYFAVVSILAWIAIPRIVRLSYRLSHNKDQLNYRNPHIHPWLVQSNYHPQVQTQPAPAPRRQLITDIF